MIIQATNLRAGTKIEYEGDVWVVLSYQHRTPGKGQACMQCKLRSLSTGSGKEARFNSTERIPLAELDEHRMTYSYHDGESYVFMEDETYEQISLTAEDLGDAAQWLTEGMKIQVQYIKGKPCGIIIPNFVEIAVTQTEPAVRGDTATNVTKAAVLECGAEVQVPLFINTGDIVKVDTREGAYVERVRKA